MNVPTSSLRNNIMIAFFLAVVLFGVSITAISDHVLRHTLLQAELPDEVVQPIGRRFIQILTGLTILSMALALGVAALLSKTITEPIGKLLRGAIEIGSGNLDATIDITGNDEFGQLAAGFNEMAQKLKKSHDELEAKVAQRTGELSAANQELEGQVVARQRATRAVRESEQRLKTILDSISTGLVILDPQTHIILDVNIAAAKLMGLPAEEIVGNVCHQFICSAQASQSPVTNPGHAVDRSECVLLAANGTEIPILKSVAKVTLSGKEHLVESFIEIIERKRAEDKLKESLSLLEATLESTADGILVTDSAGKIKSYNGKFQRIWRVPDEVMETRSDETALSRVLDQLKDPAVFLAGVRRLYREPNQQSFDLLEFKDGRFIERYSKPQVIGDQILGRVWSFRDVTERYLAEQKRTTLLSRVAEINEELSHFAYVVSHDLKAPLRGVKLITEWLCADYGDTLGEDAKEQLQLLQNRVGRMHNLIDGVLQYSRVGRIKEERVAVDCNVLLAGVVDTIAPPEHIEIVVENDLPTIECEMTRITQVFQNLLTNAVKFMDKPKGRIRVACVREGDFWKFSVADNGPGIDEKHFERIFRIFQTLAARDEFESTGVGLTLVKKIVEMYGGRIWIESELGRGSTFLFTFPIGQRAVASKPLPAVTAC